MMVMMVMMSGDCVGGETDVVEEVEEAEAQVEALETGRWRN